MGIIAILVSAVAGAVMSLQGVINARLADQVGLLESNAFVQGTAFLLALIAMFIGGNGSLGNLPAANKVYWLGGVLGIIITLTVMVGMQHLSPTVTVSVILIAQLLTAALIDAFGLFGTETMPFTFTKYLGIALLLSGVIVFKL